MAGSPPPARPTPNDPTQWAPQPDPAATHPTTPTTDPTHLVAAGDLRPVGLSTLQQLGNYRIVEPLGEGGMSVVFKAYHAGLDRLYALKVMQASPQMPGGPIERFLREARTVARIGKHPHIVQVHDVGEANGCYYLAMDLIEGGPLDRRLNGKPLPPREAARITSQAARALQAAHEAGVIHRDMKPSNILFDAHDVAHVSDFGLARDTRAGVRISQEGDVLGTPLYMAPEQIAGEMDRIGPATDVYGLGATLYEMLTGKPPFPADTSHAVWLLATDTEPKPPRLLNPVVPPDLETICLKAIRKEPSDRYATARELGDDLERYLRGEPVLARPIPLLSRLARRVARHRTVAALLLVIFLALGYGIVLRVRDSVRVSRGLVDARALREGGRLQDARAAYRSVLAIDPANGEARLGYDWTNEELQRQQADAAAKDAFAKAKRVQDVLARWMGLSEAIRVIERAYHNSTLDVDDWRRATESPWLQVEAFMKGTPQDATSQATMLALAGWARRLAGYEEEGAAWMHRASETDPDLPYGVFMETIASFGWYVSHQTLPAISLGDTGVSFRGAPPETRAMREMRQRIEGLLARAAGAKVWGEGLAQELGKALSAFRSLQSGRMEEAETLLTEAIASPSLDVMRTELLYARAKARFMLKHFDDARADEEVVLKVWPDCAPAWSILGGTRMAAGMEALATRRNGDADLAAAQEAFTRALAMAPGDVDALSGRATARSMMGNLQGAEADLDEALVSQPDSASLHMNRGNIRMLRREDDKALADYDRAIALDPQQSGPYVGRGLLLAHRGDTDGAIAAFTQGLQRDPNDLWALTGRGKALRKKGELAAGRKDYDAALAAHPGNVEALVLRGRALLADGEAEKAFADFDAAVRGDPKNADARAGRGGALVELGKVKEGLPDLEEALRIQPDHVDALAHRGNARRRLGDAEGALADYDAALAQAPEFVQARQSRGTLRLAGGDLVGAGEDFEEVLRHAGPRASGSGVYTDHYNLACIYALLSVGVRRRGTPPSPTDAEKALELRKQAFEHLALAIEKGWHDRAQAERDADLAPLHDDPRWKATLERLK